MHYINDININLNDRGRHLDLNVVVRVCIYIYIIDFLLKNCICNCLCWDLWVFVQKWNPNKNFSAGLYWPLLDNPRAFFIQIVLYKYIFKKFIQIKKPIWYRITNPLKEERIHDLPITSDWRQRSDTQPKLLEASGEWSREKRNVFSRKRTMWYSFFEKTSRPSRK
jgi:hypothetical protein